jgi:hypothetical protein
MKQTKIKVHPFKGRGVHADEAIKRHEVIEVCQLLVFNFDEVGLFLEGYVFGFNKKKVAMALGNGSLYNHNKKPNARACLDHKRKLLTFEAIRPISKGEEITINYGYSKADMKKFKLI